MKNLIIFILISLGLLQTALAQVNLTEPTLANVQYYEDCVAALNEAFTRQDISISFEDELPILRMIQGEYTGIYTTENLRVFKGEEEQFHKTDVNQNIHTIINTKLNLLYAGARSIDDPQKAAAYLNAINSCQALHTENNNTESVRIRTRLHRVINALNTDVVTDTNNSLDI